MIDNIDNNSYDSMTFISSLSIVIQCSQLFTRSKYIFLVLVTEAWKSSQVYSLGTGCCVVFKLGEKQQTNKQTTGKRQDHGIEGFQ